MMKTVAVFAFALALCACDASPPPKPPAAVPSANDVSQAVLSPKLLDDHAQMQDYLRSLPEGKYKVVDVPGQGKFYLDEPKDVIKDHLRNGWVWEPELERLFGDYVRPGTTVIDAGAHIGTHALTLGRLAGPQGRVYAFEPQKKIYRELVYNLRLNGAANVVPLRFALGRAAGVIEMSPAVAGNEGSTKVGSGGDRAELRAIDSFGFRNVSFIKIDVEGFEDEVLEGARQTIARERPTILVEIQGGYYFYENAPPEIRAKIDHTRALIAGMGYKVERLKGYDYLARPEP